MWCLVVRGVMLLPSNFEALNHQPEIPGETSLLSLVNHCSPKSKTLPSLSSKAYAAQILRQNSRREQDRQPSLYSMKTTLATFTGEPSSI